MPKTTVPHIVLTRPQAASARFADMLHAARADISVIISPVLKIKYFEDVFLPEAGALVLTSEHGLAGYLQLGGAARRAFCVGKRTAQKAQDVGFEVVAVEESLAKLEPVLAQVDASDLLYVRGKHVAGDLIQKISELREAVVYDQLSQPLSNEVQTALLGERAIVLPLFSPRSAGEVAKQIDPRAPIFAAFISDVAKRRFAGVRVECDMIAEKPDGEAMFDATLALFDAACTLEACKHGD